MAAGCGSESGLTGLLERETPAHAGLPKILAAIGDLDARLATTDLELLQAQALRYRVFFEEGAAVADPASRAARRDLCRFDPVCDHLIVVDNSLAREGPPAVVGAYRLLRQEIADKHFGFYSRAEFAIDELVARRPHDRFLELGRSCVAKGYRSKRTLELLWRGIWAYALHHRIDVMFGCASFAGLSPGEHSAALRFLRAQSGAPPAWDVRAAPGRACAESPQAVGASERAAARLPPLIKGYWRLGAHFSRDMVVDEGFGTTDVLVVLPVAEIRERYLAHFAPQPPPADLAA